MPSMHSSDPSSLILSVHARQRAQQRSIPADMLAMLLDHGVRRPAGGGAEIVHFTRAARQECAAEAGRGWVGKLGSAYAVIGPNGTVITVGHRVRRLPRR